MTEAWVWLKRHMRGIQITISVIVLVTFVVVLWHNGQEHAPLANSKPAVRDEAERGNVSPTPAPALAPTQAQPAPALAPAPPDANTGATPKP